MGTIKKLKIDETTIEIMLLYIQKIFDDYGKLYWINFSYGLIYIRYLSHVNSDTLVLLKVIFHP